MTQRDHSCRGDRLNPSFCSMFSWNISSCFIQDCTPFRAKNVACNMSEGKVCVYCWIIFLVFANGLWMLLVTFSYPFCKGIQLPLEIGKSCVLRKLSHFFNFMLERCMTKSGRLHSSQIWEGFFFFFFPMSIFRSCDNSLPCFLTVLHSWPLLVTGCCLARALAGPAQTFFYPGPWST